MTLKQGRWVKIHKQGQANYEAKENVMDIMVGESRCQAEALYTASTRTYKKAAYWMLRYLGHAKAEEILAMAAEEIQAKAAEAGKDDSEVVVNGEKWNCTIEKMEPGVFKVQMTWTFEEEHPVEKNVEEQPAAEAPAPKKRGRTKKAEAAA